MVIGVATVTLLLPHASSLKDRRRVVKSVIGRTQTRYNVAIADVDGHDVWSGVTLGIACVSTDAGHAHAVLERVVKRIERERLDAELLDYTIEVW